MHICHLYDFEKDAYYGLLEFITHHKEIGDMLATFKNSLNYKVVLSNGNTHYFMGKRRYYSWCLGRTYILKGNLMHSGYKITRDMC